MAMKRCPICGENYSDTYKSCPFCEEEAALQRGNQLRRGGRGGKRASSGNKRGQPNLLSPILVILILIMAALLVYLLFGDKIADQLAGNREDPGTEEVTPAPPTPHRRPVRTPTIRTMGKVPETPPKRRISPPCRKR